MVKIRLKAGVLLFLGIQSLAASNTSSTASDGTLVPIRIAAASIHIFKKSALLTGTTGFNESPTKLVCNFNVPVGIYSTADGVRGGVPQIPDCIADLNGKKVNIKVIADIEINEIDSKKYKSYFSSFKTFEISESKYEILGDPSREVSSETPSNPLHYGMNYTTVRDTKLKFISVQIQDEARIPIKSDRPTEFIEVDIEFNEASENGEKREHSDRHSHRGHSERHDEKDQSGRSSHVHRSHEHRSGYGSHSGHHHGSHHGSN